MEKQLQVISVLQWVLSFLVLGKLGLRGGGEAGATSPRRLEQELCSAGSGKEHPSTYTFWVPDAVLYPWHAHAGGLRESQWEVVVWFPFYRWEIQVSEKVSNLSKVTQI